MSERFSAVIRFLAPSVRCSIYLQVVAVVDRRETFNSLWRRALEKKKEYIILYPCPLLNLKQSDFKFETVSNIYFNALHRYLEQYTDI